MGNKKVLKKVLAATLLTTAIAGNIPAVSADTVENPVLVPTPREVKYQNETLIITKTVNIKGQAVADSDAVNKLLAYLEANEITVNETYQEGSTTIILGEEDDEVEGLDATRDSLGLEDAATLKDEGYVLGVDSENNGTILIEGKDGDGTFYGVQTLMQLVANKDGELIAKEAAIKDEPTMTTRGSIEGFYGTPWTHQNRLDQIKFYGEHKLNTYIYAPKDDVYHREQWREPYPAAEMEKMKELIKASKESKVDFVFSLSPGNDIKFTGAAAESDYQALLTKCELMYDMGVRSYAIFFDDISNKQGELQAAFLNRFNKEFIQAKGDITPLITVPTEYDSNAMSDGTALNAYTKGFSETLDPSIKVLWTGPAVVPEGIDVNNAEFVKSIYGERIGIWWNYPVTDYIQNKLALGPIYGLDKGLADELDFLVMNPMEHADLSMISLATGADYAWNSAAYDYQQAFENSINNLYGELAPYMYTFANHSTRLVAGWASTGRADAPEVRALMDTVIKKLAKGEDTTAEIETLTAEFDNMILAADKLKESLTADQLAHCRSNLDKLKALGESDKLALDLFIALNEGNQTEVDSLKATLNSRLSSLRSGKLVSEETALKFITDALNYDVNATAGFEASSTFVVPGQKIQLTSTSSVSTTELEWTFEGANITSSTEENPVISYQHEGVYTVSLKAKNKLGEDEVVKKGLITVSKDAGGEIVNLSLGKTATASGYTAASEAPAKAIDGITSTKWCDAGWSNPHNITIDLGETLTVSNIVISHAEVGGEGAGLNTKDYRIQVSMDGTNFKEVVNVKGNTAGLTNDTIPVTLARYVKLITDAPTQGGDKAARIYEIEVMGLNKAIDLPSEFVPGDKTELNTKLEEAKVELAKTDVYTEESLVVLQDAVEMAEAVVNDNGATQAMIEETLNTLTTALENLVVQVEADKTALQIAVDLAEAINEEDLTNVLPVVVKEFKAALDEAKTILANPAATQEAVNASFDRLASAMHMLDFFKGDKAALQAFVDKVENLAKDKYIEATWTPFETALTNALNVLADENAMQEEVNETYSALVRAFLDLRLVPNKDALKDLIDQAQALNEPALANAIVSAKAVYDNINATQTEVDNAVKALNAAISGLTKPSDQVPTVNPGDKTPNGSVKTGDTTSMMGTLGMISSLGLLAFLRKKEENK